jgi:hypothetical protein
MAHDVVDVYASIWIPEAPTCLQPSIEKVNNQQQGQVWLCFLVCTMTK